MTYPCPKCLERDKCGDKENCRSWLKYREQRKDDVEKNKKKREHTLEVMARAKKEHSHENI